MSHLTSPISNLTKYNTSQTITLKANSYNYDSTADIYSINFQCYKIIGTTVTDVTNSVNKIFNQVDQNLEIVSMAITTPNTDCVLLYILNGCPGFIQVGNSSANVYYYSTNLEDREVLYNSYSPLNALLSSGKMTKLSNGIYSYNISLTNYCFLDIIDKASTGDEYDSLVYYSIANDVSNNTGTITLQPNRFQMVAIPNKTKDIGYFVDLINAKLLSLGSSLTAKDVIQVTKAYPSNASLHDAYQVYVPGTSGDSSKFKLMIQDGSIYEINPFFVKTGSFGSLTEITITWNS